jgi:hypothetical protein
MVMFSRAKCFVDLRLTHTKAQWRALVETPCNSDDQDFPVKQLASARSLSVRGVDDVAISLRKMVNFVQ